MHLPPVNPQNTVILPTFCFGPTGLVLLHLTHRPDALAATLSAIAATARKARQPPQAAAALARLSTLLSHASSQPPSTAGGMEAGGSGSGGGGGGGGSSGWLVAATSPEAPWVLESCKLLWARVSGCHDSRAANFYQHDTATGQQVDHAPDNVLCQQDNGSNMAFTTP